MITWMMALFVAALLAACARAGIFPVAASGIGAVLLGIYLGLLGLGLVFALIAGVPWEPGRK